ncbi:MAG: YqaJ viral recombinase family protein [Ruthenibacterium sp.]
MASFDGTSKASAATVESTARNIRYCEKTSPYLEKVKAKAIANASPEAIAYCNTENYSGPAVAVDAATLTEDEWLARRSSCVGGSDCSAVFGDNKYKDNLRLYYEKIGQVPVTTEKETGKRAKLWGHISEEYVAACLQDRYPGNEVFVDTNIYTHPDHPFISANVDRMMKRPDGSYVLVEIKTSGPFIATKEVWGDDDNPNVPIPYLYQVRQYMAILGVWECVIACMFERDNVIYRSVIRDLDEEMRIVSGVTSFWEDNVLARIPPKPCGNPSTILTTIGAYTGKANIQLPSFELASQEYASQCQEYLRLDRLKSQAKKEFDRATELCDAAKIPFVQALGQTVDAVCESLDGKRNYIVRYSARRGRRTISDWDAFEREAPSLYNKYVTRGEAESRVFTMKEITKK